MHILPFKVVVTFVLLFFLLSSTAQNHWDFGIELAIHYGDYSEDIAFESDQVIPNVDKSTILPSIKTFARYKLNPQWSLIFNPTIAIKGANDVFGLSNYRAVYLDIPILADFQIVRKVHIIAGPVYSHLISFSANTTQNNIDFRTRNARIQLFAGQVGIGYDLRDKLQIRLNAYTDVDEAIQFIFLNESLQPVGIINLRNQYIEIGIGYTL